MRKQLSPEEYRVLRERGTEAPFTGAFLHNTEKGMYRCRACGAELFSSETKFDSGTGWPSFTNPANTKNVVLRTDNEHGLTRTEVTCAYCASHLGHVFDDGPTEMSDGKASSGKPSSAKATGKRYCINSVCLEFERENNKQ